MELEVELEKVVVKKNDSRNTRDLPNNSSRSQYMFLPDNPRHYTDEVGRVHRGSVHRPLKQA